MASHVALPILLLNLGGEMIYVLRQRLLAQKVDPVKGEKVLNDVIGQLFEPTFLSFAFKPRGLYSFNETKMLFSKIAHSSIMKLNETSMGKLFDLMTMVFKYQFLSCRSPRDIIDVTTTHIKVLRSYVTDPKIKSYIDDCSLKIDMMYPSLSIGQLWSLKQTLSDFLQGRNVKVSLLLQENLQDRSNGKIFLNLDGPCPSETPVPGGIRTYDAEANVSSEHKADYTLHGASPEEYDQRQYDIIKSSIGINLYALVRSEEIHNEEKTEEEKQPEESKTTASEDLQQLADLIGGTSSSYGGFKLNLFATSGFDSDSDDNVAMHGASKPPTRVVTVDAKSHRKTMNEQMDDLGFDNVESGAGKEPDSDDDDLLAMMDQACQAKNHK